MNMHARESAALLSTAARCGHPVLPGCIRRRYRATLRAELQQQGQVAATKPLPHQQQQQQQAQEPIASYPLLDIQEQTRQIRSRVCSEFLSGEPARAGCKACPPPL